MGAVILRLEQAGPHDPVAGTPARVPGSVRRTTTIDTSRPDGLFGQAIMRGAARDVLTMADGSASVAATALIEAVIDPRTGQIVTLHTNPAPAGVDGLAGASVMSRFRATLDATLPGMGSTGAPLYLLLDDLPGAALVGGYSFLRGDALVDSGRKAGIKVDICAGWADGSTMVDAIRTTGKAATPIGPTAPALVNPDDPAGWHDMGAGPGPHGTRRLRRIDVGPDRDDGRCTLDVLFRDSHWDEDGEETVIHEYSLSAEVDPPTGRITSIDASADVLPWMECPGALASASRVVDRDFADLRQWVRREMTGTSTCTHLNDTLRSLADLGALLSLRG
ncbi:DUF2889 domain-containing protein [Acidiferrimicrobium sp. IK]|uniref:DUF2889 domain-containing protein n=1 Tax=Acidiferrimicrobium sp. IK TaxID=2871700 RepID=UPI0021CB612F|nr:DUF2889 domain-containing protein [Acidiferrimicrobium sp. IK]MCU4186859.1 DUF2889 domain-containing protein [Acidiferrimicrobium sp. IK]